VFRKQTNPHRGPSPANVIAGLALFVALGGTAAAAVTLDRDSVGSVQIRRDAVRSSEIRDASIRAADMSSGARTALRGDVRVTEDDNADHLTVPRCAGSDLSSCPNRLELALDTGRNWLIQARAHVAIARTSLEQQPPSGVANRCGLVDTNAPADSRAVLDETQVGVAVRPSSENIALSAVVPERARNPSVALRCTSQAGDRVTASFIKITALTVGTVGQ
jgi:hypothetical protein